MYANNERNSQNFIALLLRLREVWSKSTSHKMDNELVDLKSKINILLPIAFAMIFPVVGYLTNSELLLEEKYSMLGRWFASSAFLYLLWHVLQYSSNRIKNYTWIFLILLAIISLLLVIRYQLGFEIQLHNTIRVIFTLTLILIIQYALKSQQHVSHLLLEKEQIQTENYKAQLKVLQNQVDPHFLFNSLNTLRSMVRHKHANSEKFILSLSELYRQTLKHREHSTLPLSKELEVLESYLFLMKSRNEAAVLVDLHINEALYTLHLPSFSLQVVVENCFKHNSASSSNPLHIEINSTDDGYLKISNNLQPKIGQQESSGLGLDLLKKRYDLMEVSQGIIIERTTQQFIVQLKLIQP